MEKKINKIVLAYSGGLDTSAMLLWLKETYNAEVVCFCADVGQGDELGGLKEKALQTGASKLYVEDLREDIVYRFRLDGGQSQRALRRRYLLGTSLARPVIAKKQIEIAVKEGADAVAHGATGKGNDQVRFELTYYALKPDVKVIAPWARMGIQGTRRFDCLLRQTQHQRNGDRRKTLFYRQKPNAHFLRRRNFGRPLERAAGRYFSADEIARNGKRQSRRNRFDV
jgi:argininosuccinate synthase